jgi:hypothetical protein
MTMDIWFAKRSDQVHTLRVRRADGTEDRIELESGGFLRHDLAHLAVELEVPVATGFWGSVATGASLDGEGIESDGIALAASLAGPVQTLMRTDADVEAYAETLARVAPALASPELASRLHDRVRRLRGQWEATRYGDEMHVTWPG